MKLLIATGDAADSPAELPASIRSLIEQAEEVFVVAPALPNQLDWHRHVAGRSAGCSSRLSNGFGYR